MNNHTLSDFHKNNQKRFLLLAAVVLLILSGISDSFAQEDQVIIMTTSKSSYLQGDTVQLNGIVSNQPGQLVAIQVKDSSGNLILIRTVQADQNGNFALQFKIPSTATSGNFSIVASARINGFIVTQTKTMTATVPEFGPITMTIFEISFLLISMIFIFSNKFKNFN